MSLDAYETMMQYLIQTQIYGNVKQLIENTATDVSNNAAAYVVAPKPQNENKPEPMEMTPEQFEKTLTEGEIVEVPMKVVK